jgi:hypothetical protein
VRFKEFEGAGHTKVFVGTKELEYFKKQWFDEDEANGIYVDAQWKS